MSLITNFQRMNQKPLSGRPYLIDSPEEEEKELPLSSMTQQPEKPEEPVPGANPHGIDPEIYNKHVSPYMAVMDGLKPKDRRPEAEADKRKAKFKLLADAIRETVGAVGAASGASIGAYNPDGVLQSMQNYRNLVNEQMKADEAFELQKANKYLDVVGRATDYERRGQEFDQRMGQQESQFDRRMEMEEDKFDVQAGLRAEDNRIRDERLKIDQEKMGHAAERVEQGWANINLRREIANATNERARDKIASDGYAILNPENRAEVMYQLNADQYSQAVGMTIKALEDGVRGGEMRDMLTAQDIMRFMPGQSLTNQQRLDMFQKYWHLIPEIRQFIESGAAENLDPLGIFSEDPQGGSQGAGDILDEFPAMEW